MTSYDTLESPVGLLFIGMSEEGLSHVEFLASADDLPRHLEQLEDESGETPTRGGYEVAEVVRQLREYFAGTRRTFEVTLAPHGTEWQLKVWHALRDIPCGQTVSYGTIATRVGRPTASRAVGAANGRNPISIIVPCHRVIGADQSLTGYGGGLRHKQWLLAHEGVRLALDEPDALVQA
ncbi:MAG: methylated-DNA--[protein]-cysteine S-methyltransferase [Chloroflexota bacterium]